MHDVRLYEYLEGLEQIVEVAKSPCLFEPSLRLDFLLQGTSIAEFIDKVVVIGSFEDFDEPDNMRRVFYFAQSLNLVDGELFQFGTHFELLDFDDFDGHSLTCFLIDGLVYFAELSLADHVI